ncbi:FkbM family methyltransferase [Phenylobacterium sp.]|uniref:FkbM family methyltransferase n=1 Tax=Phenylobacterium sp. TaxID=1871053 RepID=UPI0030F44F51
MLNTLSFITNHPLTRDRPLAALARFARWQVASRLKREVIFDWIEGSKLAARHGMAGATGNIYCGLHEFADMAFMLHMLRPGDLFVDVGANIGSYTVLASAVCGAETLAIEPDPGTMVSLKRNIEVNEIGGRVTVFEVALGAEQGVAKFTVGLDSMNRMASDLDTNVREVPVRKLDDVVGDRNPVLLKLDVEGHEAAVFAGAHATLRKKSLIAIETESRDPALVNQLEQAGFEEVFYDPLTRQLLEEPRWHQNNALFVRDSDELAKRLKQTRPITVLGRSL